MLLFACIGVLCYGALVEDLFVLRLSIDGGECIVFCCRLFDYFFKVCGDPDANRWGD